MIPILRKHGHLNGAMMACVLILLVVYSVMANGPNAVRSIVPAEIIGGILQISLDQVVQAPLEVIRNAGIIGVISQVHVLETQEKVPALAVLCQCVAIQ